MALTVEAARMTLVAIFAAMGTFAIAAGIAGWPWFYRSLSARMLTGKMSRSHARLLYAVVGALILAMACYLYHQPIAPSPCPRP